MPAAAKSAAVEQAKPRPVPTGPDWLSKRARQIWGLVAADLTTRQVLRQQHHGELARYCELFATWISAQSDITKNGTTYKAATVAGGTMERIRPVVKIARDTERELRQIEDRFGLNPVYGAALAARTAQIDPDDPPQTGDPARAQSAADPDDPIGILATSTPRRDLN